MDPGRDFARDYAAGLLADLDAPGAIPGGTAEHPTIAWALSGAMALTGHPDGPPLICPAPLAACADGALLALEALAGRPIPGVPGGARLLAERAAIAGYMRNGRISAGGSCRFVQAADGWIALNLARDDDWTTLPALFEREIAPDWPAVAAAARDYPAEALVGRGRELGLAVAPNGPIGGTTHWHEVLLEGGPVSRRDRPVVIELASLWAGPLCGHLLGRLGARVIKVESQGRPDGARFGPHAFFDLMNANKESVALDLSAAEGRERLRALIRAADIVIEGSRPRALEQMGIRAAEMVAGQDGLIWIGITGYGRTGEAANWVAYGDDAGVAAGLSALLPGGPVFCGDAVGDPLTGLHAALAAYARWRIGKGGLVSVAIRDVVGHCIACDSPASPPDRTREWQRVLDAAGVSAAAPSARAPAGRARPLGADTVSVLREFAVSC
jgi:crotonobetainyl-CoA:carnitine CoA-transferase CaiB-like acyl-CoA transferase